MTLTLGLLLVSALVGGGTEGRHACMHVLSVIHFTHVTGSGYLAFWSNCQFLQGRVDALWTVESYLDNGLMCFSPPPAPRGSDGYGSGVPLQPFPLCGSGFQPNSLQN